MSAFFSKLLIFTLIAILIWRLLGARHRQHIHRTITRSAIILILIALCLLLWEVFFKAT